jgi:AraC family transcriptional regulator, transcriptional activator of pobA
MDMARQDIARFALYGEGNAPVAPEFLHIEDIPSRSALYDWVIAPHTHQGLFQILMMTDGHAQVRLDGIETNVTSPALVCVPSSCVHAFNFGPGTQGWVVSIANDMFRDPRLSALDARNFPAASTGYVLPLGDRAEDAARLQWLLSDIAARMAIQHGGIPDVVVSLLAVCLGVTEGCLETLEKGSAGADRKVVLVRGFEAMVDQRFRDHLGVADYARALSVTPVTLTRACRAVLGRSPGDIIQDRLLLEAMRYLRHTAASAKQISDRLGFADPAYFARFFKARSGQTTRDFRRATSAASAEMA